MIAPWCPCCISGSTACVISIAPSRFTWSRRIISSAEVSASGFTQLAPALFTSTSTRLNLSHVRSTNCIPCRGSVTSVGTAMAGPPASVIARTCASNSSARRAASTTRVPRRASSRAVAAPIPELAPVIIATSSTSDCDMAPSLSDLRRHGSADWHIPQRPGVLVQVPGGGELHPLAQGHLWHIAQVAACLVDREVIVRAVELDTMSRDERRNPIAAKRGDALSSVCGGVQRVVRHMHTRRRDTDLLRDGREKCFLAEQLIAANVVDLPHCMLVVHGQEKPLHHVSYIDERHCVIPGANDDPLAGAYTIGYSAEVQAVAGAKERGRPDDDGRQVIFGHHALHELVTLRLGHAVGLTKRLQGIILGHRSTACHVVDHS